MKIFALFWIIMSSQNIEAPEQQDYADVTAVKVTGTAGNYTFHITVESPDTGCDQYADWWEVISPSGKLIYRRILAHSHVDEQPFTRSGGKVTMTAKEEVIVRAHMNSSGYGGRAMRGSADTGFRPVDLDRDFAISLEKQAPLPDGCAF
jgi:hypothetical protein